MTTVSIEQKGCRDCALCESTCPTKVFARVSDVMTPVRSKDCIGCASCTAVCPSRCISLADHEAPKPFHRIEENSRIIERMLRTKPMQQAVTDEEVQAALGDVRVRLFALGESVTETMGRGVKAVGRKAGTLAATHLPDLYEHRAIGDVLTRLSQRFSDAFRFDSKVESDGQQVTLDFPECAVATVVRQGGQTIGSGVLCTLFHEYWAGLIGSFTGKNYQVELLKADHTCSVRLTARG